MFFHRVTNTTTLQLATDANTTSDSVYVGSTLYITNNAGRGNNLLFLLMMRPKKSYSSKCIYNYS